MHTCPNGKRYIGITGRNPLVRWANGRGYKAHNKHFYNAILKYGWDNIEHRIIASDISKECACEIEKSLIKEYQTNNREFGYNKSTGGENPGEGVKKVLSEETKRKISETQKGRKLSQETIHKRSISQTGLKRTFETRKKMSEKAKIAVLMFDLTENLIAEYDSILEASMQTNIAKQNICKCCKGERNTAGGYVWRYKSIYFDNKSTKKVG